MNVLRSLLGVALRAYPSAFRERYGDDIRRDFDAASGADNVLKTLVDAVAMRYEDVARDLAYAVSRLRRAPLFVAIVTITFALGIGVNVAVFSAFNAVVVRPLPFANAARLVTIGKRVDGQTSSLTTFDIDDLRSRVHAVSSIAGYIPARATILVNGKPVAVKGANVTPSFFATFDAVPQIGRFFDASDARQGRHGVVISDSLWRTYFGGTASAVGKRLVLDGVSYAVIGVMRAGATVPEPSIGEATVGAPDYVTLTAPPPASGRRFIRAGYLGCIAALRAGATAGELNAELLLASQQVRALYPRTAENAAPMTFVAQPLAVAITARIAPSLWMVLAVVLGTLLVACANVSNVIGARWSSREREVAVRRALGATTRRIAMQLFIETGVLALAGGVAGVIAAYAALRLVPASALSTLPRGETIRIDGPTLLYALLMVGVTTVIAGFGPVWALGRSNLPSLLSGGGANGDVSRRGGLRSALVVAEVAVALAVVVSSGLLVRSLVTLLNAPIGFDPHGVTMAPFVAAERDDPKRWAVIRARERTLLARASVLPGAEAVAIAVAVPLNGAFGVFVPDVEGAPGAFSRQQRATGNIVSEGYFRALGIPVLQGRGFTTGDALNGAPVAIVSQTFADRFLSAGALGQRVRTCPACQWSTVVGVVPDVTQTLGEPPLPVLYTPAAQHPPPLFSLIVRAPSAAVPAVRNEIRELFAAVFPADVPPTVYTVSDVIALETRTQRFAAVLLSTLALIPLGLAISGIYGVVAFAVEQRTREFGIRIALGARTLGILADVMRRALATTAIGVAAGIVLAAVDARAIAPFLQATPDFSARGAGVPPQALVSPFDPLTFAIVIAIMFACASLAALVPALRAARVDPGVALRYE